MGRAAETKENQIQYMQNRTRLLAEVVKTLDASADSTDLDNILSMLDNLKIKVKRFSDDWKAEN